jgi:peptide/nickel transport system permease protein
MVMFRGRFLDYWGVVFCVTLMSISSLFYIILGQLLFAKWLRWVPVSGYQEGWDAIRFLVLPVAVGVLVGLGSGARWYRSIVLEESAKPYVQAARAKGLSQWQVLFRHVLKNAMIPILTGVVVIIPSLFMGSLIMESFFGIPGLGSYTIDAIAGQDFEVVRVMVFLGTLLYILGLILTDLSYAWVDPRVKYD